MGYGTGAVTVETLGVGMTCAGDPRSVRVCHFVLVLQRDRLKVVLCLSSTNLLFITRNYEANGMIGMYRFPRSIHTDFKARECQRRW